MGQVTFKQLNQKGEARGRVLILADHAAPHGRPRQEPVVSPEQRIRQAATYYTGSKRPTRHIFGSKLEPITLKGRLTDRRGTKGFAQAKHEEIKRFVDEAQLVQVTWDDILDCTGLIVRYLPGFESKGEITYELEVECDEDLLDPEPTNIPVVKAPASLVKDILSQLKAKDKLPFEPPTLKGSVSDVLNGMVSDLNSASALLVDASNEIDSFATATVTAIQRFRAGLGQTKVAVGNLRRTYDNSTVEMALENESATESQQYWDLQSQWTTSSLEAERLIAEADRAAALAEQGQLLALHTAALDETWESISEFWFRTADRAEDIRVANGVPAGQPPVPGTTYFVPS